MSVVPLTPADPLARLAEAARAELAASSYPDRPWLKPLRAPDGTIAEDVIVVGGGQSGVIAAAFLGREGVSRVAVLDRAAAGAEGPWTTFARMAELRTPKTLVGNEFGIASLSLRAWYRARHGAPAWDEIDKVPREDWKAYLDWYAAVTGVAIENGVAVRDVREAGGGLIAVETDTAAGPRTRFARAVVIATGFDGCGAWRVPDFVAAALPADRYDHSNGPIDFARLAGKRIGVLGHGASAFDNAVAALRSGAASVDLCFRRARLPRVNPHRFLETGGVMTHFPALSDDIRWRVARFFRASDQPPPLRAFTTALAMPGFRLHAATPWTAVRLEADAVSVTTPKGDFVFDHLILATGAAVDLAARPELASLAGRIALWADRYDPPPGEEDARLAALPYLGEGFEFLPKRAGDDWVRRVFAFNSASAVSHGPHSTSISGHRHALPRLVRGVTRRLLVDAEDDLLADLAAYRADDLPIPDDFEASLERDRDERTAP